MLNSRTRSARARPASASLMCSASAIIAFELMKPLTMRVHAAGGHGLAQPADHRRVDRRDQRDHDGAGGAVGPPGRPRRPAPPAGRTGRPDRRRRCARPAPPPPGCPPGARRSVRPAGPEVRSVSLPGTASTRAGRGLRQAGGHGPAVAAALGPQRPHGRLAHRECLLARAARPVAAGAGGRTVAAVDRPVRRGPPGPRAARSPPPKASKLPVARAFGCLLGQVAGELASGQSRPPGCREGMPSLGCRIGMPAEGSRASVTSRKPSAKVSFVPKSAETGERGMASVISF